MNIISTATHIYIIYIIYSTEISKMYWSHWSVFGDKPESAGFRTSLSEEKVQLVWGAGPSWQMSMTRMRTPLVLDSSRWWFQRLFYSYPGPGDRGNDPIWQIHPFKWIESTSSFIYLYHLLNLLDILQRGVLTSVTPSQALDRFKN